MRALDTVSENAAGVKRNPIVFHKNAVSAARRQKEFTNKSSPLYEFFSTIESRDLRAFFSYLKIVEFTAGERIVRRKTHDSSILLIFKGRMTLFGSSQEGSTGQAEELREGAVFGLK